MKITHGNLFLFKYVEICFFRNYHLLKWQRKDVSFVCTKSFKKTLHSAEVAMGPSHGAAI